MDIKLENLIEKIKKDGIDEARKISDETINKAKEQAAKIKEEAGLQAENIIRQAKDEAEKIKKNGEQSLKQAARDLVLSLKEKLALEFDQLLKKNIAKELKPDFLKELIVKIIDKWLKEGKTAIEIFVNKGDKEKLEKVILGEFKKEAAKGIELKISNLIDKGFRIGLKGDDLQYDFTEEGILESFKEFLNPMVSEILDRDNG